MTYPFPHLWRTYDPEDEDAFEEPGFPDPESSLATSQSLDELLLDLRRRGYSYPQLAAYLADHDYPCPKPWRKWNATAVRRLVNEAAIRDDQVTESELALKKISLLNIDAAIAALTNIIDGPDAEYEMDERGRPIRIGGFEPKDKIDAINQLTGQLKLRAQFTGLDLKQTSTTQPSWQPLIQNIQLHTAIKIEGLDEGKLAKIALHAIESAERLQQLGLNPVKELSTGGG